MVCFIYSVNGLVINYSALFFANAFVKTRVPLRYWLRNFYRGGYLTLLLVVVREGEFQCSSCHELVCCSSGVLFCVLKGWEVDACTIVVGQVLGL